MANFNKVILAGNLTRDPQLSYLPSQQPVVEFGLAINRRWNDRQSGQQREETCFVDCRCYGRQAEVINQYMSKGKPILIEGRLQFDTWEGKDGTRRSKHRVIVEGFTFLGQGQATPRGPGGPPARAAGAPQGAPHPAAPQGAPHPAAPQAPPPPPPPPPPDDFNEPPPPAYEDEGGGEEIPF